MVKSVAIVSSGKRTAYLLFVASISWAAIACADAPAPAETTSEFTASDSAGVRKVVNVSPGWKDGEQWSVSAEPVLILGKIDGPEEHNFHRIQGATRLSDGRIAVLDAGSNELRFFSTTGEFLSKLGRTGDGPGEFRSPRYLEKWDGDTIQITADWSRIRISPEGLLLSHDRLQPEPVIALGGFRTESCDLPTPMFIREDILLCEGNDNASQAPRTAGVRTLEDRVVVASWSLQGVDTVGHFFRKDSWFADTGPVVISGRTISGGLEPFNPPLVRQAAFWVGSRKPVLLYTSSDTYRIEAYDLATQTLSLVVEKQGGVRQPTTWEVEQGWTRAERLLEGHLAAVRAEYSVPDSVSEIDRIHLDDSSSIWARHRPTAADQDQVAYDIFASDGVWLGQVALPSALSIFEIGLDYILGVRRDALGVEQVVLYQLNRS